MMAKAIQSPGIMLAIIVATSSQNIVINIVPVNQTVVEGEDATFACSGTVDGTAQPTRYRIRSGVTDLQTVGTNISDLVTVNGIDAALVLGDFNSQLLLRGVTREANGYTVTCSIRVGAVFQDGMNTPPAHITVAYPPAYSVFPNQPTTVLEGEDFTYSVGFDANPPTTNFTWSRDSQIISSGTRIATSVSTITITSTIRSDSGVYEVVSYNEAGRGAANFTLDVQYPPVYANTAPVQHTQLMVGAPFTLNCTPSAANPPVDTVSIDVDRSPVTTGDTVTVTDTILTIPSVQRSHSGNYYSCNATNTRGSAVIYNNLLVVGLHNDTVRGDPLFSIPLPSKYITDPELKSIQLCFEVHGQLGNHYNLISDRCTSVTALYSAGVVDTAMNVITKIGVKTQGTSGACHSVKVDLDNCSASLDGAYINKSTSASVDGVRMTVRRRRIRVSVPNCEVSKRITMWVICTRRSSESLLEVVVARGDGLEPTAHGVIGQFWNIPLKIEPYVGQYGERHVGIMDKFYSVTVSYPNAPERTFIAEYDERDWFDNRPCLYAGNGDGGRISEVRGSDSVIEGTASSYVVWDLFSTDFEFSKYNRDC